MMDFLSFPDTARVWIYAADREIPNEIAIAINNKIIDFTKEWSSHQMALKATGGLLHKYFIVFVVDDGFNKPGGCSIDSSVHFVKSLGQEYGIDFFNRSIFYYLEKDSVKSIRQADLSDAVHEGKLSENTMFFDTLVQTKLEFQNNWLKPLRQSWHSRLVSWPAKIQNQ
jgi:hypothetical protein